MGRPISDVLALPCLALPCLLLASQPAKPSLHSRFLLFSGGVSSGAVLAQDSAGGKKKIDKRSGEGGSVHGSLYLV